MYIISTTLSAGLVGFLLGVGNIVLNLFLADYTLKILSIIIFSILLFLFLVNKSHLIPTGNFAVPSHWLKNDDPKSAAIWGIILGLGIITYQSGPLFHAYIIKSLTINSLYISILAGLVYGFTRSVLGSLPVFRRYILKLVDTRIKGKVALEVLSYIITLISLISVLLYSIYTLNYVP